MMDINENMMDIFPDMMDLFSIMIDVFVEIEYGVRKMIY